MVELQLNTFIAYLLLSQQPWVWFLAFPRIRTVDRGLIKLLVNQNQGQSNLNQKCEVWGKKHITAYRPPIHNSYLLSYSFLSSTFRSTVIVIFLQADDKKNDKTGFSTSSLLTVFRIPAYWTNFSTNFSTTYLTGRNDAKSVQKPIALTK